MIRLMQLTAGGLVVMIWSGRLGMVIRAAIILITRVLFGGHLIIIRTISVWWDLRQAIRSRWTGTRRQYILRYEDRGTPSGFVIQLEFTLCSLSMGRVGLFG